MVKNGGTPATISPSEMRRGATTCRSQLVRARAASYTNARAVSEIFLECAALSAQLPAWRVVARTTAASSMRVFDYGLSPRPNRYIVRSRERFSASARCIRAPLKENIERRTPNTERRISTVPVRVRCSMFDVRCSMFDVRRLLPLSSIRPDPLYFRILPFACFFPPQFRLDKHVEVTVHDALDVARFRAGAVILHHLIGLENI
jgi:hypothetical protein